MAKFTLDDADARFFEGQAGKHEHKWEAGNFGGFAGAHCRNKLCTVILNESDIESRLNATDKLSRQMAIDINLLGWVKGGRDALMAYAAALSEHDKPS